MKFLGVLFCVQTHVAADEDLIGMMRLKRPSVAADNWQHRRERDSSLFLKLGVLTDVKYRSLPSFTRSRVMDLEHGGKICKYVYGKRMHYSDDYYGGRCADQLSDF